METRTMGMEVRKLTVVLMILVAFVSMFLFPHQFKSITMGIIIGAFTGVMGFNMICNMALHLDGESVDVKSRAMRSYARRYLVYVLIFGISACLGIHILALLVGMLTHKISILVYTFLHRKEDECGS